MQFNLEFFSGVSRSSTALTCVFMALLASADAIAGAPSEAEAAHAEIQVNSVTSPARPQAASAEERTLKLDYSTMPIALEVTLPPASAPKRSTAQTRGRPLQVAFHRNMPDEYRGELSSKLDWIELGDGSIASVVRLTLLAGAATTMTAQNLEQGDARFSGLLGDGTGKWRLEVSSDQPIQVMSLLRSPRGNITNLSR